MLVVAVITAWLLSTTADVITTTNSIITASHAAMPTVPQLGL